MVLHNQVPLTQSLLIYTLRSACWDAVLGNLVHMCKHSGLNGGGKKKTPPPARCHLLFYCTSIRLNMFQALLCPSSGAHDNDVHYHIARFVLGLLYVGG